MDATQWQQTYAKYCLQPAIFFLTEYHLEEINLDLPYPEEKHLYILRPSFPINKQRFKEMQNINHRNIKIRFCCTTIVDILSTQNGNGQFKLREWET